ncbi:hypothetical protein LUZ61_002284 [Rhynchospora tenuis]|uniref:Remorin C-terminal domain-containing protein n=1 Tax=Rhynchospora tenuis TaxID=198213 RepID=A0AAD5ZJ33_9POAL|nr:hypothetical protein LUZ61_002284 [Rhynchospora tenuis]
MEYERIHKVQVGVLSPTKLRMKLLGSHNRVRTGGGVTDTSSSRTSPSKIVEPENAHNSLLSRDTDEEDSSRDFRGSATINHPIKDIRHVGPNSVPKFIPSHAQSSSLSTVHPIKTLEEDQNQNRSFESGQDTGNGNNFEFHHTTVERISQNPPVGNFSRGAPSKWNNAEKWVLNRQNSYSSSNALRRLVGLGQCGVGHNSNSSELRAANKNLQGVNTKRIEGGNPAGNGFPERFSFQGTQPNWIDARNKELGTTTDPMDYPKVTPSVPQISTRDIGTEMTPIPSQDPSMTCTPLGSITPTRSPNASIPSTPFGEKAEAHTANTIEPQPCLKRKGSIKELSDNELKIRTRKEIAALGVQLGKMRIVSWASKGDMDIESSNISPKNKNGSEDAMKRDYETRAVAWQEAENSRHDARFKREEVKIHAWESSQRAKFEAEMLKIEAKAERMRAEAVEKMSEKLEITRQTAEEKRAAAEAHMKKQAARAAQKAQLIRQTGRVPSSHGLLCCSGFF